MPLNNGVYRDFLDTIALKQLTVPAFIPQSNLYIDSADNFQPYGMAYYKIASGLRQTVVIPDPTFYPIEAMAPNFQGNPVKAEDFPQEYYFGSPIGGI
jgi:hypothetical protein